jgi:predicted  nucleic acid-binding Zn-ribbon protein
MAKKKIPKIGENVNLESAFSSEDEGQGQGQGLDSGTSPRMTGAPKVTEGAKNETPLQAVDRLTSERDSALLALANAEREISSLKVAVKKESEKVATATQSLHDSEVKIDTADAIRSRVNSLESKLADAEKAISEKDRLIDGQEKELLALREKGKDYATSAVLAAEISQSKIDQSKLYTKLANLEKEIRRKERKLNSVGENLAKLKRDIEKVEKRKKIVDGGALRNEYEELDTFYRDLASAYDDAAEIIAEYEGGQDAHQDDATLLKTAKIVLIGDELLQESVAKTIFNKAGFDFSNVQIVDDYDKLTNRNFSYLRDSKYKAVLLGPVPHSMKHIGDENSIKGMLEAPDFPYLITVEDKRGELKITKSSLMSAVEELRRYLIEGNKKEEIL